ncbi:Beta-lactamase [Arthrobotrys entomopaga]|nr:Beta-lactamase [Arthrobotrys entomopaga]
MEEKRALVEDSTPYRYRQLRRRDVLVSSVWNAVGAFVGFALAILLFNHTELLSSSSSASLQRWLGRQLPSTSSATQLKYTGPTILAAAQKDLDFQWKCIPPPPPFLLADSRIHSHHVVLAALADIEVSLRAQSLWSKDAFSVSVVHASKGKIFEFHSGRIRTNESAQDSPAPVDGDSIFRIASITKLFTVLEALILGNQARLKKFSPELSLGTRLQDILPEFKLPSAFREEEATITLAHLGSHTAGLGRDIGELEIESLDKIKYPPPDDLDLFDDFPHNRTAEETFELISERDLVWEVGQSPSYSNTGFSLLGLAVERYHDKLFKAGKGFSTIMQDDIFTPLAMNHTFMGPIPAHLRKHVTVPASKNFVDKVFGPVHDPAGGIFSTTNDMSSLLHKVLLASNPLLITPSQRLTWLKSYHQFTDGISSVGTPWETFGAVMPDHSMYNVYFKGGGLPAQVSEISTFPEFGYGMIALTSIGLTEKEFRDGGNIINPMVVSFQIHNYLAPALWEAYNSILIEDYVGIYVSGDGFAKIAFKENMLVLEKFFAKGVDVLLKYDEIIWTEVGKRPRVYRDGAKLFATAFEGQFRATAIDGCSWAGFDAVTSKSGWGVDKIVIKTDETGKTALVYEPMKTKLYKVA